MEITSIDYKSSNFEKDRYISSQIAIWNHPENLPFLSFTGKLFTENIVKNWIYGLKEQSVMKYYTAVENEQVIGIIVLKSDVINGFEICGIGVNTNWKRKKIGSRLIETAIEKAKQEKFKSIETLVFCDNKSMLMLALKYNFQPFRIDTGMRYDGMNIVALKKII